MILTGRAAVGEVELPIARNTAPIAISADQANRWVEGSYDVYVLRGNCQIEQGAVMARGREAVLWVKPGDPGAENSAGKIIAYLEGDVAVEHRREPLGGVRRVEAARSGHGVAVRDRQWLGRFHTTAEIELHAPATGFEPPVKPAIYRRAIVAREAEVDPNVRLVQFNANSQPAGLPPGAAPLNALPPPPAATVIAPGTEVIPAPAPQPTARSIVIRSRDNVRMQGSVFPSPDGRETLAVITSGVNIVVSGIQNVPGLDGDKVDIETDRVVVWTARLDQLDLTGQSTGEKIQSRDAPLELYLEGNIVFRQGDRVITADRMYYNVRDQRGMVLNAELLTPAPGYAGLVRLKADVLQQVDEFHFQAFGAAVTSSRIGVPRYWLQAEKVAFRDERTPKADPLTGQLLIDPIRGEPAVEHNYMVTSQNNFVYLGGLPVLYWPVMATNLETPSYYVESLDIGNDRIFGLQILPELDAYQLLRWSNAPEGTKWTISPDYLSERGFGLGSTFTYDRLGLGPIPGRVNGLFDSWFIKDHGLDDLGRDRMAVVPATDDRGRVLWQHRHMLSNNFQFTGEAGWISDRNFLEQYFENEWDQRKDETTGAELKWFGDQMTASIAADLRINQSFTQTGWLPRVDHFALGRPLLKHFTWFAHSHVGYAQLETAELPPPGSEPPQASIPWETDTLGNRYDQREGLRAVTRQEIDLPLPLGPFKLTPYALGEVGFWNEDRDGEEYDRAYGQLGIRGSLPFWRVDPQVKSQLFNLNGLSHKVTLDADFFWADADQNFDLLPLYDPLQDDSSEHFTRRFINYTYGGTLPTRFDDRYYALRSGMQSYVTGTPEIADDLMVVRTGLRQRWQTKRGLPGQERIVDWIVFDLEASIFPDADRDNFGEEVGLANYDFRWHLGDRVTLLSDGYADFFEDGLRTASIGGTITRPQRGQVYLGYRVIDGPINSNIISAALNYRMSHKWIVNGGASIDLNQSGNIVQNVDFIRVSESFLIRLGFNADLGRENVGVNFSIEPRFLAGSLGRVGGAPLLPVGMLGIE